MLHGLSLIHIFYQLERLAAIPVDYAAIPYTLYEKSLYHPLSESGGKSFVEDYQSNTF